MAKKTVNYNKISINKLPNDKPVIYKIKTAGGKINYVGVAKKGRVQERLAEHLTGGENYISGAKIQIEQCISIAEAMAKETSIIANALSQRASQVKSPARIGKVSRRKASRVIKRISTAVGKK